MDDVESDGLTLYAGDLVLAFDGSGNSSWTWHDVDDPGWTDGDTVSARIERSGAGSSDATDTPLPPTDTPTATDTPVAATNTPTATAAETDTPSPTPAATATGYGDCNVDLARWIRVENHKAGPATCILTKNHTLNDWLPPITSKITFEGRGYSISGNNRYRIFWIERGGDLTVNEITLKDGRLWGREYDYEIEARGGAIYNLGKVTINRSTVRNNMTGGGLDNYGHATIINSTFADNHAWIGGAFFNTGTIDIINSTFVNNSTISGWPSGISNHAGTMKLRNSIVVNSWNNIDCGNRVSGYVSKPLTVNINNYIEDGSCSLMLSASDGDLRLGTRAGSPGYYPLLDGSIAIDRGHPDYCPATDQAGNARPIGAACDIGAHETTALAATDTPTDTPIHPCRCLPIHRCRLRLIRQCRLRRTRPCRRQIRPCPRSRLRSAIRKMSATSG